VTVLSMALRRIHALRHPRRWSSGTRSSTNGQSYKGRSRSLVETLDTRRQLNECARACITRQHLEVAHQVHQPSVQFSGPVSCSDGFDFAGQHGADRPVWQCSRLRSSSAPGRPSGGTGHT
jgi:hypothetical protein